MRGGSRSALFPAVWLVVAPRAGGRDGTGLARVGSMDRLGADRLGPFGLGRDLGRAHRDRRRRPRRKHRRPAAGALGQLSRRFRRHPAHLSGRHGDRPASRAQAFLVEHEHRHRRLLRSLPRRVVIRPLRDRLALAAGADRRHFAVHDLGRGRLRGHGRDRLQPHRAGKDHPRRLLRQRPRHRARPGPRLRPLRCVAGPLHRGDGVSSGCCRFAPRLLAHSGTASASRKRSSWR